MVRCGSHRPHHIRLPIDRSWVGRCNNPSILQPTLRLRQQRAWTHLPQRAWYRSVHDRCTGEGLARSAQTVRTRARDSVYLRAPRVIPPGISSCWVRLQRLSLDSRYACGSATDSRYLCSIWWSRPFWVAGNLGSHGAGTGTRGIECAHSTESRTCLNARFHPEHQWRPGENSSPPSRWFPWAGSVVPARLGSSHRFGKRRIRFLQALGLSI